MANGDAAYDEGWTAEMDARRSLLPENVHIHRSDTLDDYYSYIIGDITLEQMLESLQFDEIEYQSLLEIDNDNVPVEPDITLWEFVLTSQIILIIILAILSFTLGVLAGR